MYSRCLENKTTVPGEILITPTTDESIIVSPRPTFIGIKVTLQKVLSRPSLDRWRCFFPGMILCFISNAKNVSMIMIKANRLSYPERFRHNSTILQFQEDSFIQSYWYWYYPNWLENVFPLKMCGNLFWLGSQKYVKESMYVVILEQNTPLATNTCLTTTLRFCVIWLLVCHHIQTLLWTMLLSG